ncbi:MAG TPA: hypothetical protein VFB63_02970 [Bryobacteraceae bacterium]|jgi:hypothetical protein|nr:hypothetical protein [Bryobacteraceae bacterium]
MLRRSFLLGAAVQTAPTGIRLATFQADITPRIGAPIYTGTARSIVDPLEARGIVLHGSGNAVIIVALDWCEIRNRSYDLWRSQLAAAAGTTRERVLVSCVHQHDAPYTDLEAQQLLESAHSPHRLCDASYEHACIASVTLAIRSASAQPVTHIGIGEAILREVASNRRYVRPDGKVSFGRTSATRDPAIREQPEGLIDPALKAISFWNDSQPVAALYTYSTHPMSHYGQGDVSADFPGIARRRMQTETPGVFTIYCSGASGDTMAGRYNDGNPANRAILAGRLYQAMSSAWRSQKRFPLQRVRFQNSKVTFQPRKDPNYSLAAMRRLLDSAATPRRERLDAALGISWLRRLQRRQPIDVPVVHLGPSAILLVPAEAFVQYQLWAQQASTKQMVMTLGYGECAPGYIPTNAAVAEGYDDHYSWVDFGTCEGALRHAIESSLTR